VRTVAPRRVGHTYRQQLVAPPGQVFPLLCPVRERDWARGWEPRLVVSASGLAETDCVFTTTEGAGEAVWYVTRHDPAGHFVEMIKITPGVTACRLDIRLEPAPGGCAATISYTHTSLGPAGDAFVEAFTAERYATFMREWERELNHYLATGEKLPGETDP
jgi:hypothetical protein